MLTPFVVYECNAWREDKTAVIVTLDSGGIFVYCWFITQEKE